MAGNVKYANLTSCAARAKLKAGRQPHWHLLVRGRVHLGYQRWPGEQVGRWVLRQYRNKKYSITTLGLADDIGAGLSFTEAEALARAAAGAVVPGRLTVAQAMANHIACK